jgi:hypothetical protein
MLESAALVLGALGGGALAALTAPRVTYVATLPFVAVSTVLLLAFREPRLHEVGERRSLRQHVAVTFGVVRHERRLLPIAALLILTSILTQAIFEFGPLWLLDADAGAGAFGPAWAGLMASLGFGGALAGRLRPDRTATIAVLGVLLVGSAATLLVASDVLIVTVAQISAAVVSVVVGIFLTRQLHDAVPSDVRSGVASGIGAATWATFLPFALAFGAVSERWGIHAAGVMLVAIALAVVALLAVTVGTFSTVAEDPSPEELTMTHDLAPRPLAA